MPKTDVFISRFGESPQIMDEGSLNTELIAINHKVLVQRDSKRYFKLYIHIGHED